MNLEEVKELARAEMEKYHLSDWTLDMNYNMKTTFGRCNVRTRTISLSAILVALNDKVQVLDTIRHEIAHAVREQERGYPTNLTAGMWHDSRWKQIAALIGATPTQFYNAPGNRPVVTGKVRTFAWRKVCPKCGATGSLTNIRKKNLGHATCGVAWNYVLNK